MNYRILKDNEKIKNGDEFKGWCGVWIACQSTIGDSVEGAKEIWSSIKWIRRPIKGSPAKSPNKRKGKTAVKKNRSGAAASPIA
jgi:hypothetical protein